MVEVSLENVTKKFEEVVAVDNVSFKVREGEILTLLGPSGCGKSTTLRTIAGFYFPDSGKVYFGDKDITNLPPQDRNTAMVFQNYALWPHMSVRDNVTYGLKLRKVPREEQERRAKEALKMVQMGEFVDRMPLKLSGGQQQRVAVARCLIVNPDVLLMDEPLSNLDAKLRLETRKDIRDLVKELSLTAIYVTHDQEEALSISDYIVVMHEGRIRQTGKPRDIWDNPENSFVGTFIGEANLLELQVKSVHDSNATLEIPRTDRSLASEYVKRLEIGKKARIVLRPEKLRVDLEEDLNANHLPGRVKHLMYHGTYERLTVKLTGGPDVVVYRSELETPLKVGQVVYLRVKPRDVLAFGPAAF
ncbi:MAG: ABC transporter ATP-binding protein [Candidatus Heimdallarchaeota archaeon]|nr:MAG: ABC transporter ATP-binding protein [Candidatus Heimdallarchaeota archaeon]